MDYEGRIYRPPSEASSLLIQITVGCTWNKCTFCDMYKDKSFKVKPMPQIEADLEEAVRYAPNAKRIFLCDGDALALSMEKLEHILKRIQTLFPHLEGVRSYASAKNILNKTPQELALLHELGLDMVYLGLESGSEKVLEEVNKGITAQEMVQAATLLKEAGIKQSVSIISGLGGQKYSTEHIVQTAKVLNAMQPDFVGLLVLYLTEDTDLYKQVQNGEFTLLTPVQVVDEMQQLIEQLQLEDCYFTSTHASNYVPIRGHLPQDKEKLLNILTEVKRK